MRLIKLEQAELNEPSVFGGRRTTQRRGVLRVDLDEIKIVAIEPYEHNGAQSKVTFSRILSPKIVYGNPEQTYASIEKQLAGVEGVPTQVFDSVEAKLAAAQQALQALQCRLKDPGQIADAMYTSLSGTNGLSKYDPDRSLHCRAAMVSLLALRPNAKLVPDPVFSVRF